MHRLLPTKKARIALLIGTVFVLFIVSEKVSLAMDLHTLADSAHNCTSQKSSTGQAQVIPQSAQQNSLAIVPNSQPTGTPATASSAQCGQGGTTANGSTGPDLRYFAAATPVSLNQAQPPASPQHLINPPLQ